MSSFRTPLLLSIILFITALGCNKDEPYSPPSDPKKAILGKWELIQMGNYPNMEDVPKSGDYIEYKPDSVLLQVSANGDVYQMKYWIDSLYHEGVFIENIPPPVMVFQYIFYCSGPL
jgi:hypothetical protein